MVGMFVPIQAPPTNKFICLQTAFQTNIWNELAPSERLV